MNGSIAVPVCGPCKDHARIGGEQWLHDVGQNHLAEIEETRAILDRIRAFDRNILAVEKVLHADLAGGNRILEGMRDLGSRIHRPLDQYPVFVADGSERMIESDPR